MAEHFQRSGCLLSNLNSDTERIWSNKNAYSIRLFESLCSIFIQHFNKTWNYGFRNARIGMTPIVFALQCQFDQNALIIGDRDRWTTITFTDCVYQSPQEILTCLHAVREIGLCLWPTKDFTISFYCANRAQLNIYIKCKQMFGNNVIVVLCASKLKPTIAQIRGLTSKSTSLI